MKNNKLKNYFISTLIVMLLFSCLSDDSISVDNSKDITGTWNSISFLANEPLYDVNNDGINSLELLDELPCRYSIFILNEDQTFYQENNTWQFNSITNTYSCTNSNQLHKITGTWSVNSEFTLLSLEINGNISFLNIEFDGDKLKFNSSESFLNKNVLGDIKKIYGKVIYTKE